MPIAHALCHMTCRQVARIRYDTIGEFNLDSKDEYSLI